MPLWKVAVLSFTALVTMVNPLAVVPSFIALTDGISRPTRASVAFVAALSCVIVLAVFLIAGNYLIARLGRPPGEIHALDDLMPRLPASAVIVAVIVWNALVLIPTLWICWKTGERPRWRWGDRGGSIPPDRGASS